MDPITAKEGFELEIHIEELESKIAPDGGETVLPLSGSVFGNGSGNNLPSHGHFPKKR